MRCGYSLFFFTSPKNSKEVPKAKTETSKVITEIPTEKPVPPDENHELRDLSEDIKKSLEDQGLLLVEDDYVSFGYSSPWPMWDEDTKGYTIDYPENDTQKAEILYYAWSSEPHVTVWKETIDFEQMDGKFTVTNEKLQFFEEISSRKEFLESYPFPFEESLMNYYEKNGMGESLNNNALLSSTKLYLDLFKPDTAAIKLLNIDPKSVKTETVSCGDADVRDVIIEMSEGKIDIEMIHPYGAQGIWLPRSYELVEEEK